MTCNSARYGYARKMLLSATLALGVLIAFSHPGRAFASLSTTDQSAPAAAAPAAPAPLPPSAAPVAQTPPAAQQQQRRATAQRAMPHRPMASQGFNDPERAARRRAFVGGVIVGIVAARLRR